MKSAKKFKVVFAPDDKVNKIAHDLVWKLFGHDNVLLTNESQLEDFVDIDDIPGHKRRLFSELTATEQRKYHKDQLKFFKTHLDKLLVWYPLVSAEEWTEIEKNIREELVQKIHKIYGVIIPEVIDGETRIWKVSQLILEEMMQKKES